MLVGKEASEAVYSTRFAEMEFSGYRGLKRWHGPGFLVDLILVEAKATGTRLRREENGP